MSDKKKSISKKIIIRLAVLGFFLFLGTGLAGGIQLYKQNLKIYKDAAESYVNILYYQIGMVNINEILEHEQEIRKLSDELEAFYKDKEAKEDEYWKIVNRYSKETFDVYQAWSEVDSFTVGFGNICKDIRYACNQHSSCVLSELIHEYILIPCI